MIQKEIKKVEIDGYRLVDDFAADLAADLRPLTVIIQNAAKTGGKVGWRVMFRKPMSPGMERLPLDDDTEYCYEVVLQTNGGRSFRLLRFECALATLVSAAEGSRLEHSNYSAGKQIPVLS